MNAASTGDGDIVAVRMLRACVVAVVVAAARGAGARVRVLAARADDQARAYSSASGYSSATTGSIRARPVPRPPALHLQTIALRIWDIGDLAASRRESHLPERGLRISWQSYLRVDHDFGDYTSGQITLPLAVSAKPRDALDVIPELSESVASLELLYGYVELAGLLDDRLTIQIGRVLADDGWGTTGIDGGNARFEVPAAPLAVSVSAGFRVRASSPLGLAAYELDGTSGAACQEYVEGPTPGTGTLAAHRSQPRDHQTRRWPAISSTARSATIRQPTVGFTIATSRIHGFGAELGYRRTWSGHGRPDRPGRPPHVPRPRALPERFRAGPGERRRRGAAVGPRARRAVRGGRGDRAVRRPALLAAPRGRRPRRHRGCGCRTATTPSSHRSNTSTRTFDGDSDLQRVLDRPHDRSSARPYQLAGPGADPTPAAGCGSTTTRPARRRSRAAPTPASIARSAPGGARGSTRCGTTATAGDGSAPRPKAGWHPTPDLWLQGRAITLAVASDEDSLAQSQALAPTVTVHPRYVTSSTVLGTTWQLSDGVALHTILEADYDAIHDLQYRAIGMFDFAFTPEP